MTDHGQHQEAVGFAGLAVQELRSLLIEARTRAEQTVGVIVNAVSEQPVMESGRNALDRMAGVGERLEELIGVTNEVIAELNRYGNGF